MTTEGTLVLGITRHYIRINPASTVHCADENPNRGTLFLPNQPPGARNEFPRKRSLMPAFWGWFDTASAARTTPLSRILFAWSMQC